MFALFSGIITKFRITGFFESFPDFSITQIATE